MLALLMIAEAEQQLGVLRKASVTTDRAEIKRAARALKGNAGYRYQGSGIRGIRFQDSPLIPDP